MSDLAYHLEELAIAADPSDPRRCLPTVTAADRCVLDVGCGIGQTLVSAGFAPGAQLVGVDVDPAAIEVGKQKFPELALHVAPAERLPFPDATFDLVLSRVALPHTDVPRSVAEIHRVLKPGGRIWFMLHRPAMELRFIANSLKERNVRAAAGRAYAVANGVLLHFFGVNFPRPWSGTYGSFQTQSGFTRLMKRHGFVDCRVDDPPGGGKSASFIFQARKPGPPSAPRA